MRSSLRAAAAAAVLLIVSPTLALADDAFAVMVGPYQVGLAGSVKGHGTATLTKVNNNTICWGVTVFGLDTPTELHIHKGIAGVNGDVAIALTPPTAGNPGAASGCLAIVDSNLVKELFEHPQRYYVNLHTTKFPEGAIRGQLF